MFDLIRRIGQRLPNVARCLLLPEFMIRRSVWAILGAGLLSVLNSSAAPAAPGDSEPTAISNDVGVSPQSVSPPASPVPTSEVNVHSSLPNRVWYGAPIMGLDLVALGLGITFVGTGISNSSATRSYAGPAAIGAGLVYSLGGPIVHASNGQLGMAGASLGIRVGLVVVGTIVGAGIGSGAPSKSYQDSCSSDQGCNGEIPPGTVIGGLIGFTVGAITASVIDISILSYKEVRQSTARRVALVPAIDPKHNSAGLSLVGVW